MIACENNGFDQIENTSSSSENEFKELDNEIEKVVRGETPFEDGCAKKSNENKSNHEIPKNSNKNNPKSINNLNTNNRSHTNKSNSSNYCNKSSNNPNNDLNLLNIKEISNINSMIDPGNRFQMAKNNFSNNPCERNINYLKNNILNNMNKNNLSFNFNPNNIIYNSFSYNIINNNNLNEFMAMNNNNSNNDINYINKINEICLLNNMVNHINDNLNSSKYNVNNSQLFSSIGNYSCSSDNNQNLNNIFNNLVINNQMISPININVQFTNNKNKCNIDNINNNPYFCRNILNNNDFNNNINNYISHYINKGNVNINNIIKDNNETIVNQMENRLNNNYIDSIINNIISNNQILNNINNINNSNNNNQNNFTFDNNNNKQFNGYRAEKKNKNSNKRKIFNPLSESEKEKNIINLMDIFQCKDLRTTLMIKNIPNKYTLSSFLDEINEYFKNTYDIFYLPIDYINKCNLGFAFINFVEPFHIILFYELYRGKKWKKFNSDKICELLFAKFQGRKELLAHFEKGKVLSFESEDKRPLILPPPTNLPKINIPFYYLELFHKLYPYIPFKIRNINNKNNRLLKVFSINGNFHKN
jgi:hypothetical protein